MPDIQKVVDSRGYHLPHHKIEQISELINKTVKLLINNARFSLTLAETNLVLEIAAQIINAEVQEDG